MLTIGHHHDVTFKVNVMGTSAEPTARLVIGTHPELSFPAKKVGDVWHASLRIPADMDAGSYPVRVEVVVNNRHFTPLVKQVELVKNEAPAEVTQPEAAVEEPVEQAITELPATDEIEFTAEVPKQDETQPQAEQPRISIIQMVADREKPVREAVVIPPAPGLASLKKVAEAEVPKVYAPVVTPLPKPSDVKSKPVKVKLSDVARIAEDKAPVKKTAPSKKPKPVVELKAELPVKLIKGDITYE